MQYPRRAARRGLAPAVDRHIAELIRSRGFRKFFAAVATERRMNDVVLTHALGLKSYVALARLAGHGKTSAQEPYRRLPSESASPHHSVARLRVTR